MIGAEAAALAEREPMLRPLVQPVLVSASGLQMLARVLAARLSGGGVDRTTLEQLMTGTADDELLRATEADIAAVVTRDPACPGPCHVLLNLKGFQALQTYRFAHRLWQQPADRPALGRLAGTQP